MFNNGSSCFRKQEIKSTVSEQLKGMTCIWLKYMLKKMSLRILKEVVIIAGIQHYFVSKPSIILK